MAAARVRSAGASHEGPARSHNEDAFGIVEDATAALVVVADGLGASQSGRNASDLTVETCLSSFRDRSAAPLDELAEIWWRAEHSEGGRAPRRPYTTLPIADRAGLRDRVRLLLEQRVPDALGDVAVLEGEARVVLGIPARALERANAAIFRRAEAPDTSRQWRGHGAAAVCVIFAAGQASIAHVGDCRVSLIRRGSIEALTKEHTLVNDYANVTPALTLTPEQIAEVPTNVITRMIGMMDKVKVDTHVLPIESGDALVLASDGLWRAYSPEEIRAAVRAHGVGAAAELVKRGTVARPDHPGDNLTAVVVEIA